MYTRLYQQCNGTTLATSSVTKFMAPHSCNYYVAKKQVAENIVLDVPINIQYQFKCIDYNNLENDFKKIIEKESAAESAATANLFNPIVWGPAAWKFFETVAFGYPDNPTREEKDAAFKFFDSLRHLLPCGICKEHYKQNFKERPVNVESKATLSRWYVDFHNIVNESLGKPKKTYEEVSSKYPADCEECSLDGLGKK